jgi:hypothetical protein
MSVSAVLAAGWRDEAIVVQHSHRSLVPHGNKPSPCCLNQIGSPPLDVGQALHGNWWRPNHLVHRDT